MGFNSLKTERGDNFVSPCFPVCMPLSVISWPCRRNLRRHAETKRPPAAVLNNATQDGKVCAPRYSPRRFFPTIARSFPQCETVETEPGWKRRRGRSAADVRAQLLKTANAPVAVKVDKFQPLVWKSIIARQPPKPLVSPGISNLPRE